jgi:hypothetical protein
MIVYLWQAGTALGVTDDSKRARSQAARFMRDNGAARAVVETSHYDDDNRSLDPGYVNRGGLRWEARRQGSRIVWSVCWSSAPKPEPMLTGIVNSEGRTYGPARTPQPIEERTITCHARV